MINYLFSGIDKVNGFTKEQATSLKKDIKDNSIITFIASDFDNTEKTDTNKKLLIDAFNNIGINFKCEYLVDKRVSKDETKELLNKSDIVFIMGGDTYKEMKSINEYDIKEDITNRKLILGVSAGSLNQSKNVVYLDEYQDYKLVKYEGLGLVDFNIYPHLDFKNIDFLKEVFTVSNDTPLIALPNESFIRCENGNIEYFGEHYNVENSTIDIKGHDYEKINHTGTIPLETERLILRRTSNEDIDEFFFIELNPKLREYLGPTKLGNNLIKNREYFDESKYENKDFYRWTIVKKEDNKVLGTIYLNIHDEKAKTAGIDYWIREDEWGHGYITEASKRILEFAFDTLDLNRIESCGAKDNPGTWKVMEKLGLKYEGTRKQAMFYYYGGIQDLVLYGLTKEEYLKNKENVNIQ